MRFARSTLAIVVLFVAGLAAVVTADGGLSRRHVVVAGVPLDEVHPTGLRPGERRPGVVVAHGFAGSARLMAPFGDSLAARGYVVVLLDFSGHGASEHGLPDGAAATETSADALSRDLDTAVAYLRGQSDVDPARIALAGHSMGATAVTRYGAVHRDVSATVAISLPDASVVRPDLPKRLLVMPGALELPAFREQAEKATAGNLPDRRMIVVPGVEHIGILFATRTHRETADWLDATFKRPPGGPTPWPGWRALGGALLLIALAAGMIPLSRSLLAVRPNALGDVPDPLPLAIAAGPASPRSAAADPAALDPTSPGPAPGRTGRGRRRRGASGRGTPGSFQPWPRLDGRLIAQAAVVAGVAAVVGAVLAAVAAPLLNLPQSLSGYLAVFAAITGAAMLGYARWRGAPPPSHPVLFSVPVFLAYAAVAVAAPLHLGVTYALPSGPRWSLLAAVWAGFALLAYGIGRITAGDIRAAVVVSGLCVLVLAGAVVANLASSFLILILPLLGMLLLWQAVWTAVLRRYAAPPWLTALVASLPVAYPLVVALPMLS